MKPWVTWGGDEGTKRCTNYTKNWKENLKISTEPVREAYNILKYTKKMSAITGFLHFGVKSQSTVNKLKLQWLILCLTVRANIHTNISNS